MKYLSRRLEAWKSGEITELLREGRTIQTNLATRKQTVHTEALARSFAKLMFAGQVKAALCLLSKNHGAGILELDAVLEGGKTVRDALAEKHPIGAEPNPGILLARSNSGNLGVRSVYFEQLRSNLIHRAAFQTEGAAGSSGLDAVAWPPLSSSFGFASTSLCESLSLLAKRICTTYVDPTALNAPLQHVV